MGRQRLVLTSYCLIVFKYKFVLVANFCHSAISSRLFNMDFRAFGIDYNKSALIVATALKEAVEKERFKYTSVVAWCYVAYRYKTVLGLKERLNPQILRSWFFRNFVDVQGIIHKAPTDIQQFCDALRFDSRVKDITGTS